MKLPVPQAWAPLDAQQRRKLLARPRASGQAETLRATAEIVEAVRREGDEALRRYTERFDRVPAAKLGALRVEPAEFTAAFATLTRAEIEALQRAIANVEAFHAAQRQEPVAVETTPGVRCERVVRPVRAVGLYVPAGSAPLPSTVIMLGVPSALAGCPVRILCTAPDREGRASPAVLVAAQLCGIDQVYRVGGAQAIAAMAYGTASIPKVDKIFGPGNAWVTAAKQLVAADAEGAALDLPAGPSEVLVIADGSAHAGFVAADLLAQAEHDADSQAILLTDSAQLAAEVVAALARQVAELTRQAILEQSVSNMRVIVTGSLDESLELSNRYAPEHLILHIASPRAALERVESAGSVFVGPWTPETLGDYCSGTNHVLPTYGHARAYSGLSVQDFCKRITVQEATAGGLASLGPVASTLARLEGLDAHAAAVERRLAQLHGAA